MGTDTGITMGGVIDEGDVVGGVTLPAREYAASLLDLGQSSRRQRNN